MGIEEEIKEAIRKEINDDYSISNLHGIDLKNCLVEPYRKKLELSLEPGEFEEIYVVFEEAPKKNEGYIIAYNPLRKEFGLGMLGGDHSNDLLFGYSDFFLQALRSM